jgi:EpsI family protein
MPKRSPNYFLIIVLLLAATAVTYWAQARSPVALTSADVHSLPTTLGHWTRQGEDGKTSKEVLEAWGVTKDNFLTRSYADPEGNRVELMVVYKGLDRRGWHLSEVCFSGSGSNVKQSVTRIPYAGRSAPAVQLVAEDTNTSAKVVAIYLFARGKHTEASFARQQGSMLLSRVRPARDGWAFVRVTGQVVTSEADALKNIRDFFDVASGPLVKALTCPPKAGK